MLPIPTLPRLGQSHLNLLPSKRQLKTLRKKRLTKRTNDSHLDNISAQPLCSPYPYPAPSRLQNQINPLPSPFQLRSTLLRLDQNLLELLPQSRITMIACYPRRLIQLHTLHSTRISSKKQQRTHSRKGCSSRSSARVSGDGVRPKEGRENQTWVC